jgi:dihydroflavonol-4-reductase
MPQSQTVLVTGASGFIARHIIVQLLNDTDFKFTVRGTARSTSKLSSLLADLRPFVNDPSLLESRFQLVAADLNSDENWDNAVKGVDSILHVASPFPSVSPKDPNELIAPARDGTLRVLRAAKKAGIKRIVITSSLAAVVYGVERRGKMFTDRDWSNVDDPRVGAYEKSKAIAEKAAWDFVKNEYPNMELTTVNPGAVLGPMIGPEQSTSLEVVQKLMKKEFPACPNLTFSFVDVRDVAAVHIAAIKNN